MAKLLYRLNQATPEEAVEVRTLLNDAEIDYYETSAGTFGLGVAAIWLAEDSQWEEARQLLADYGQQRAQRVKNEFQEQRQLGREETFGKKLQREPLKVLLGVAAIALILAISLWPFLTL